jgi:uncharacterized protein YeaO (DUF488 family)
MLKTASIQEISARLITKRHGYLVVTTRYYPRTLPREFIHEYISTLAPSRALLHDFRKLAKKIGHNEAFRNIQYTKRFELTPEALAELQRLSEMAKQKDVYLGCYCSHAQYCHRDLLLIMANALYEAPIDRIKYPYSGFNPEKAISH